MQKHHRPQLKFLTRWWSLPLVFLLGLLFTSPSHGAWEKLASDEFDVYVDYDSRRFNGSFVFVSQLWDYEKEDIDSASMIRYLKVDCTNTRAKTLVETIYKYQMGRGYGVETQSKALSNWEQMLPDSFGAAWIKKICTL